MISRKPAALAALTSAFTPQSSTSSISTQSRGTRQPLCRCQYATIAGNDAESNDRRPSGPPKPHTWPVAAKGHSCPTPYQIFAMTPTAPYSKARFYELVKLYHPDLANSHNHSQEGLSATTSCDKAQHAIKLERYRLLVAAHTLLSDPSKRHAYDRFGAGWAGRADTNATSSNGSAGPFSHSWNFHDPIFRNGTWEDWERFHARQAGTARPAAPLYMANSYFLALLLALAMVGGSMNYGRAQDAGHYFVEQRDIVHDRSSKDLRRVRREVQTLGSRDDRIEFFVRQREATLGAGAAGYGQLEEIREERANRMLGDGREVCKSGEVEGRET